MNALPDIPRVYTALAEWLACLALMGPLPRRLAGRRFGAVVVAFLLVQSAFLQATGNVPLALWAPCMAAAVGLMYLLIWCCCDVPVYLAGYTCAEAFILAEFMASIQWQTFCLLLPDAPALGYASAVACLVGYGMLYAAARTLYAKAPPPAVGPKSLAMSVLMALIAFAVSNLGFMPNTIVYHGTDLYILHYIRSLVDFSGLLLLMLYRRQLLDLQLRQELDAMDNTLRRQYDQYKQSKENLRVLNRRYHDLKIQIAAVRAERDPGKQKEYLDEMENRIARFESEYKTGHPVLDTVLTTKGMYCTQHAISLTCVANGHLLDFLSTVDICTIFGIALDNAIEEVRRLDKEQRLIRAAVFAQKGFLMFRCENPCARDPRFEDGLPVSTKPQHQRDYGLKSVRRAAEAYGGQMTVHVEDGWFYLRVLLPLPEQK